MPDRSDPDAQIGRVAARQYGLFSLPQAVRAGVTTRMVDHRVASGRWERMHRGVFRMVGAPDSFRLRVLAACLACGPDTVASHRTAAALWAVDGMPSDIIELLGPRRIRIPGITVREAHDMVRADVTSRAGIPITSPARTLVDLAAVLDASTLEDAVDDVIRRDLVTLARLKHTYLRLARRGRPGVGLFREMLDARPTRADLPDSPLEKRLLQLIQRSGLPEPLLHHRVLDRGRTIAIVDLAYPGPQVAIEADGYRYHHGRRRWQGDLTRMNALTTRGWKVLRFTDDDVRRRPAEVIAAIARALGWERELGRR